MNHKNTLLLIFQLENEQFQVVYLSHKLTKLHDVIQYLPDSNRMINNDLLDGHLLLTPTPQLLYCI
jgi:hypothetical protein